MAFEPDRAFVGEDFALETTLATKSYVSLIKKLKQKGYTVTLLFFLVKFGRISY